MAMTEAATREVLERCMMSMSVCFFPQGLLLFGLPSATVLWLWEALFTDMPTHKRSMVDLNQSSLPFTSP